MLGKMVEVPAEPVSSGLVTSEQAPSARPSKKVALPSLPAPPALEGVKSKRRAVLSLGLVAAPGLGDACTLPATAAATSKQSLLLGLGARASVVGLTAEAAASLLRRLAGPEASDDGGRIGISVHEGLRVATLAGPAGEALVAAAAAAPHVVCVDIRSVRSSGGACAVLKNFKGALLVLEVLDGEASSELDDTVLRALGVTSRWAFTCDSVQSLSVPDALETEMIADLKLRDLLQDPQAAALVAAAQPVYDEHFHESLLEDVVGWENSQVGFLVAKKPGGELEFCGLIVYKHWGAPLRSMSILRVVVPQKFRMQGFGRVLMRWAIGKARELPRSQCTRITLCSMPDAIPFYERLQFTPIPLDDMEPIPQDDSLPQPMPGSLWMELKCGRAVKATGRR